VALNVDRDSYEAAVFKTEETILVDFWGPQCLPCLALNPAVESLEKEFLGRVKVAKVNAAENRMLCAKLRVLGLPTFIIYKAGEEVKRLTGNTVTEKEMREAVKAVLLG
jgi:thioredoxin 1